MNIKLSFNMLRPILFFLCGLGYFPLQSADQSDKEKISLIKKIQNKETKKDQKYLINLDIKKPLN